MFVFRENRLLLLLLLLLLLFSFQEFCGHKIFGKTGSSVLLLVDGNFLSILMVYMRVTTKP